MQFSVYAIMDKIMCMENIVDKIEEDAPLDADDVSDIHDLLQEYTDILKSAKVNV